MSVSNKPSDGYDNNGYEANVEDGYVAKQEEADASEVQTVEVPREQWSKGLEFLMACIAGSVGLGNMWRFPVVAYENGGGAFLIPYLVILAVIGRPLYYMEMIIGQFSSRSNAKAFGAIAAPLAGNGYAQLLSVICIMSYYGCLLALTVFYFVNSFTGDLPWAKCRDEWVTAENVTCVDAKMTAADLKNITTGKVSSSELYFTQEVLKEIKSIANGIGVPDWRLVLCLFGVWGLMFLINIKGIRSAGKAAYFLAIFPYVVILVLLGRAVTLEGAGAGIEYFFTPQWDKILEANVWYAAVSQCFFSLSVGLSPIIMYSSYNDFRHNIYRDSMYCAFFDILASLLAGCTIFGILGNLAFQLDTTVDKVLGTGSAGLAFVSYPDAIAKFEEVPWLFGILFFFMLFTLGQGSLMALQNSLITGIMELYPKIKVWYLTLTTTLLGFLLGLLFVTPGGQHLLTLVDHYAGNFVIYATVIIEVCAFMWWYGLDNFCLDVEFMLNRKVGFYWRLTWGLVTPVVLIIIFVYFMATLEPLSYGGVQLPTEAEAFGWCLLAIAAIQVPLWTAYYVNRNKHLGFKEALRASYKDNGWGPKNPQVYSEWKAFKDTKQAESRANESSWLRRKLIVLIKHE